MYSLVRPTMKICLLFTNPNILHAGSLGRKTSFRFLTQKRTPFSGKTVINTFFLKWQKNMSKLQYNCEIWGSLGDRRHEEMAFCICENKDAVIDQRLFHYIERSSQISNSSKLSCMLSLPANMKRIRSKTAEN